MMTASAPGRPLTFIVRLFPVAAGRIRGVVEMVRTGRKYPVRGAEDVARVISAALAGHRETERPGQDAGLDPQGGVRGDAERPVDTLSSVNPETRILATHPLRPMRALADQILRELSPAFSQPCAKTGQPTVAPERLLRALLLQILYSVRSERLLVEELEYNLLFHWFVGLSMDEPVWEPTVFTKNRQWLLDGEIAQVFFERVLAQARSQGLLSDEHFTVDTALIDAWANPKSAAAQ